MIVRKTCDEDVKSIVNIVDQAKAYLKSKNVDQWQDGYPNADTFYEDIKTDTSYVLVDGEQVVGTMRFAVEIDPDYVSIDGKWLTDGKYGVIHRIAVLEACKGKGYARILVDKSIALCKEYGANSLRIDTHEENTSMRRFLSKNGFKECGIVYIRGKDKRIAYELVL